MTWSFCFVTKKTGRTKILLIVAHHKFNSGTTTSHCKHQSLRLLTNKDRTTNPTWAVIYPPPPCDQTNKQTGTLVTLSVLQHDRNNKQHQQLLHVSEQESSHDAFFSKRLVFSQKCWSIERVLALFADHDDIILNHLKLLAGVLACYCEFVNEIVDVCNEHPSTNKSIYQNDSKLSFSFLFFWHWKPCQLAQMSNYRPTARAHDKNRISSQHW